jgi:hypothetical protein
MGKLLGWLEVADCEVWINTDANVCLAICLSGCLLVVLFGGFAWLE